MIEWTSGVKSAVKKFEVISIEPSDLAHFWVVSYKIGDNEIEKEAIEAIDPNEAFIKFRNMMIKQFKNRNKGKRS